MLWAMAERALTDHRIQIQMSLEENIPLISVDAAMLEQAFLNIYRECHRGHG